MTDIDLATEREINLATVALTYDGFRRLAVNPHLSKHERIGFPDSYRSEHEAHIFEDVCGKLPQLARRGQTVLDIGPGCADLPRLLIELCGRQGHELLLIDSPEMLGQLPDEQFTRKIPGAFPACVAGAIGPAAVDVVICYSVLHYLFLEANPFHALDTVIQLLAPGGAALFGDIPNQSKRRRFFSSAAGEAYHRAYTGRDELPDPRDLSAQAGKIDDSVLLGMMQRAQLAGCDAYLLPQADRLPMANRRDDLLIRKP